jgi:AraC-like DNA-binding protein
MYLRELREQVEAPGGCVSARLGDTAADLTTTTMLENLSDPGTAPALGRTLCQKVVDYIEDNLGDPDLTPTRIADAHYISRRYLYMIFTASQKMPVLEWIRLRRLERCRQALLDPAMAEIPVSRIAARWGMPNPALFSRAFKRTYGLGPSVYRQFYGPRLPGCGGLADAHGSGRYARLPKAGNPCSQQQASFSERQADHVVADGHYLCRAAMPRPCCMSVRAGPAGPGLSDALWHGRIYHDRFRHYLVPRRFLAATVRAGQGGRASGLSARLPGHLRHARHR